MSNQINRISRGRVVRDAVNLSASTGIAVWVTAETLTPHWLDVVVGIAWWLLAGFALRDLIRSAYWRWNTVEVTCGTCEGTGVDLRDDEQRCPGCSGEGHVLARRR